VHKCSLTEAKKKLKNNNGFLHNLLDVNG